MAQSQDYSFQKDASDRIEGIIQSLKKKWGAIPGINQATTYIADSIIRLDKATGLEDVTDANVATMIGAKYAFTKGMLTLHPLVAIKAAFVGAVTSRILATSNVADVRGWARENCSPEMRPDSAVK
ncbi:MAG: hypothetical protein AAF549_01130 [Pseudomonadota bacterium]